MASSSEKCPCRYADRICTKSALPGQLYCGTHILSNADAPYQQCAFACQITGFQCSTPVFVGSQAHQNAKGKGKRNSQMCKRHAALNANPLSGEVASASSELMTEIFTDAKLLAPLEEIGEKWLSESAAGKAKKRKLLGETSDESVPFGIADLAQVAQQSDPRNVDIHALGQHRLGTAEEFDALGSSLRCKGANLQSLVHPFANLAGGNSISANSNILGAPQPVDVPSLSLAFTSGEEACLAEDELMRMICEKTVALRSLHTGQFRRLLLAMRNAKRDQIEERNRVEQEDVAQHNQRLDEHAHRSGVSRRREPLVSSTSRSASAPDAEEAGSSEPNDSTVPKSECEPSANANESDNAGEPSLAGVRKRAAVQMKMELIRSLKHYAPVSHMSRTNALLAYRADRLRYARAIRMQRERAATSDSSVSLKKKRKSVATETSQLAMAKWRERFNQAGVHQCAAVYEDLENAACSERALPFSHFCFKHILLDPEQVLFSKCESPDCCTPAINTQKFCRVHASLKFIQNAAHAPVESNYSDS